MPWRRPLRACLLLISLCACAAAAAAAAASDTHCYWNSKEPHTYFSTITPYDDVRGDIRDEPPLEGCEPWGLWALARHGARLPSAAAAAQMRRAAALRDDILAAHAARRGRMCAQDIQDLANWTWDSGLEEKPMDLTNEGWSEMQQLGARVRSRYGALLGALGAGDALFRPTDTPRTRASARAFLRGLRNDTFTVAEPLPLNESCKYCDKCGQDRANESRVAEEESKFYNSDEYQQMLRSTRRRLGVPALSPAQAAGLYQLCRHLRARTPTRRHAWCAAFHQPDLQVLEYLDDLRDYYERGPGSARAAALGAATLQRAWRGAARAAAGARRVEVHFSHDTALQMLFTAMGLFRDLPPLGGLRVERARLWRTALLTPFAANIIIVVHKCSVNGTEGAARPQLQVFVNERAVWLCGARACDPRHLRALLPATAAGAADDHLCAHMPD